MFVHHTKLDQLLKPESYSSQAFWSAEVSGLFRKSWQYAGLASAVANEGDYLACDVAGIPVVIRNAGGKLVAFKNVCAHRHSMLVRPGCGHSATLKCMYHGWEYGEEGRVSKIPDGKSFKGIKAADYCLEKFRIDRIGPLLFVNCSGGSDTLRESLGELAAELDRHFGSHELVWRWVTEHRSNWKIIEENAVESYHVPNAHPSTYVNYKNEALHDHRLEPAYTRYADIEPWGNSLVERGFRLLSRLLIPRPDYERFKHTHIFPNSLLYYNELFSSWAVLQPLSPERSRYEILGFVPTQVRGGWLGRVALRLVVRVLIRQIRKILLEDMEIWPYIHRGLANSQFDGVLACREERVHAFQKYVAEGIREKPGS